MQDFYAFYQGLPLPKRLMAFSKFGTTHYASDGERHQPSSGISKFGSIRLLHQKKPIFHQLPGQFNAGDWLLFGAETTGLPDEVCNETKKLKVTCPAEIALAGQCDPVHAGASNRVDNRRQDFEDPNEGDICALLKPVGLCWDWCI